jgi:hypothetical protein
MEADEQRNLDSEQSLPGIETLEEQLRRLPQPAVPDNLEAKLTAAIPTFFPARASRPPLRWSRWWIASAGALTAAAAACAVLINLHSVPDGDRQSDGGANGTINILSQRFGICDPKETDPCNILPPLSNGQ